MIARRLSTLLVFLLLVVVFTSRDEGDSTIPLMLLHYYVIPAAIE